MSESLITAASGRHPVSDDGFEEMSFPLDDEQRANPFLRGVQADIVDTLAQEVIAAPTDLMRHTRRISYAYEHNLSDVLFAAFCDLFRTLGSGGFDLRLHLLRASRKRMQPDHERILFAALRDNNPLVALRGQAPQHSVLDDGIEGETLLVVLSTVADGADRDVLIEAREYIEYSQLDQARALLEEAIVKHPERIELHEELVGLYRATRNRTAFLAMHKRLAAKLPNLPGCWQSNVDAF